MCPLIRLVFSTVLPATVGAEWTFRVLCVDYVVERLLAHVACLCALFEGLWQLIIFA